MTSLEGYSVGSRRSDSKMVLRLWDTSLFCWRLCRLMAVARTGHGSLLKTKHSTPPIVILSAIAAPFHNVDARNDRFFTVGVVTIPQALRINSGCEIDGDDDDYDDDEENEDEDDDLKDEEMTWADLELGPMSA